MSNDSFYSKLKKLMLDNALAFLALLFLRFFMLYLLPGSQVDLLIDNDLNVGDNSVFVESLTQKLGLDKSVWGQFFDWSAKILQGDFGYSYIHASPVSTLVFEAIVWTLALVVLSIPISLIMGVSLGILAGSHGDNKISKILFGLMTLISSIPSFVIALILLTIFSFNLNWFPSDGGGMSLQARITGEAQWVDIIWHGFLPLIAVSFQASLRYFYLSYGLSEQVSRRPFIFFAKMRGVRGTRLYFSWYLPNIIPEVLSKLSSTLPGIISSMIFVEIIFSYPGAGSLMLDAINNRDYALLQGCLVIVGGCVLILNTALDLASVALAERG
ncbi:ABC transporter permease [Marinomonas algarum]|uniref:ABC transporter permease n=1 Tax=Marinomonas algarum TaxID=2883105 RepID=A0A9X1RUL4_9GAMM|nr:ABC transporter permease [Marinomonas algarum]MCB5163191.1 ABC transporter permease [Marinomonas algarum]